MKMDWNETRTDQAKFPIICQASWLQTNDLKKLQKIWQVQWL
jgi:hypothetical protein